MKNEKIGIIGFGAIGQEIYKKISRKVVKGYTISGIFSDDINTKNISKRIKCNSLKELLKKKPNIIIEAASVEAFKSYAEQILRNKIDLFCLSVCSFADKNFFKKILFLTKKTNNKIYIPTGAISGLDALSSASLSNELKSVKLIQRKPPKALLTISESKKIRKEKILLSSVARKICKKFPKNSNIAATLAICGVGFDSTRVKIIADPKVKKNIAEIEAYGKFGKLSICLENNPSDNPKTSRLTAMSILLSLKKRKSNFLCAY
ncbi:MAG: L-aspartate dehydrogenase [Alphaproteobacteria bacterium MarineAlpha6_Bin4]|nr:MAG: L-aspartate dehydrogenase [Alphaproteobacteria bacterium MarineAlpha6_Bin3]PPR37518.1 MAG: L-aspartate dehydrogenase [Alphaproteobacteria bacterium MarineAlpha6_Bin4]